MRGRIAGEPEDDEDERQGERHRGPDDDPGPRRYREEERQAGGEEEHHAAVDGVIDRDGAESDGPRKAVPSREQLDSHRLAGAHGQDDAPGLAHVVTSEDRAPGWFRHRPDQRVPAGTLECRRTDPEDRGDGEKARVGGHEGIAHRPPADAAGEDHRARRHHQPDEHAADRHEALPGSASRKGLRVHGTDLLLVPPARESKAVDVAALSAWSWTESRARRRSASTRSTTASAPPGRERPSTIVAPAGSARSARS